MCHRAKNASSELVCVQLSKSICMPVLLYAVEVLPLTKIDVARLDRALDRAVFRIFGCSSSADISYIWAAVDIPCVTGYTTWHGDAGIFRDDILHVFRGPLRCWIVLPASASISFFSVFLFFSASSPSLQLLSSSDFFAFSCIIIILVVCCITVRIKVHI